MKIKNNTKQGYIEAEIGDGIDISSRMESHRGTVQKGLSQTLTCEGGNNVGVVVSKKIDLCDKLIEQGKVVEGNIVKHSRTKNAAKNIDSSIIKDDAIPSLTTRPDVLGVVVNGKAERERENRIYVLENSLLANVLNLWDLLLKITKVWLKLG